MGTNTKQRHYFKHLDFAGYWMVIWFGKLSRLHNDPFSTSIYTYIGKMDEYNGYKFTDPAVYRCIELPIGDFPLLYIGAILKNGYLFSPEEFPKRVDQIQSIKVDFSKKNLRAFSRTDTYYDTDDLIVPSSQIWGFFNENRAKSYLLGFVHNDIPFGLIIPCSEILRFFYCYASNIAKIMTSNLILNPGKWLYDLHESSFNSQTGVVTIKPRLKVSHSSAVFLACFISGYFNIDRAQQIPMQISAFSGGNLGCAFTAFPPLDGVYTIKADCKTEGDKIIVTRIISADLQPNFTAIAMGTRREDNNEIRGQQGMKSGATRTIVKNPSSHALSLNPDTVNHDLGVEEYFDDELSQRFPKLSEVVQVQIVKDGQRKTASSEVGIKNVKHATGSTSDTGSSKSDSHGVIIMPGDASADPANEEKLAFRRIVKALRLIKSTTLAEVKFLRISKVIQETIDTDGVVFNFPDKKYTGLWSFIDKASNQRRRIVIASIKWDDQTRILVEFEQRVSGECCTLVIWKPSGLVPKYDILLAVNDCIKNNSCTIEDRRYKHSWSKLRHSWKNNEDKDLNHFLKRIFSAKPMLDSI